MPRCHCQAALSPAAYAWYNAIRDEKRTAGASALNSYRLMLRAQELDCAVALYGHTHVSEIEYAGGVQIVCRSPTCRAAAGAKASPSLK
ncbi:MAG: hypothetical protein V8Q85_05530 [Christensenellales bacterium]